MLTLSQKKKIISFARKTIKINDSYHDFSHLQAVAKNALALSKKEGGNKEVCWASAMLHDICKCKKGNHGTEGAKKARKFLNSLKLDKDFIESVCDAIHFHNKGFRGGPIERQILWDADKLTIIGPYGFTQRHLPYQVMKKGKEKGIPSAVKEYHFFEIRFHTKTAKRIVAKNAKIMLPFFRSLLKGHKKVHGDA